MEKYIITRDQSSDVPSRILSDIYRDVTFKRQMMATRVDSVRADSKKVDDPPVWRGDHTFSSDAAKYSFLNFIEPEVAQKHPDWSKQKIRKEALVKFQQRLEQDLSYEQKESSHQETAVHWRVIETAVGTQELATEYGGETITLRQLWDHTREYAAFVGIPAAYNPDEEKAQYAMEQAFVRGDAQAYISVLSHPDAIRYVQVWEKDSDGGIQSKQIDLYKTTGRDFSHMEGDVLVKHLAAFTETANGLPVVTTESSYAHFIVQSGSVQEQDIRTIAMVQAATRRESLKTYAVPNINKSEIQNPVFAKKESKNTFADVQLFVVEAINKKIIQLKEIVMPKKVTKDTEQNNIEIAKKSPVNIASFEIGKTSPTIDGTPLHINEFIKTEVSSPITEVLAQLVITKTALNLGAISPEISGGALYWLATFVENKPIAKKFEQPAIPQTISEAMVSMMRSVRVFFEKGNEAFIKIHRRTSQFHIDVSSLSETITRSIDQSEKIKNEFSFFEQITQHISESRPVAVFVMLQRFAEYMRSNKSASTELSSQQTGDASIISEMGRVITEDETNSVPAIFGIFYWIFLSYNVDAFRVPKVSKIVKKEERDIDQKHMKHNKKKEFIQPPWVLLGIIWHLAMVREAAMVTSVQNVVQAVQVADPTSQPVPVASVLPMTGVIFLSSFVLE